MTEFKALSDMTAEIEHAEMVFDLKTSKTYDESVIAAAAGDYNKVLEAAAHAIIKDLGITDAAAYLEAWKPKTPVDTWFGPTPGEFIRHVLKNGTIHRDLLPGQTAIH